MLKGISPRQWDKFSNKDLLDIITMCQNELEKRIYESKNIPINTLINCTQEAMVSTKDLYNFINQAKAHLRYE